MIFSIPNDLAVVDIETTGLDIEHDQICEIAALKVEDGKITGSFSTLCAIEGTMPEGAGKVNGITDEMLAEAPSIGEAIKGFTALTGPGTVLCGHNIKAFDLPFIERVAKESGEAVKYAGVLDTLELAREVWPGAKHSMWALRGMLGIDSDGAHRALKDCMDELEVLLCIKAALNGRE